MLTEFGWFPFRQRKHLRHVIRTKWHVVICLSKWLALLFFFSFPTLSDWWSPCLSKSPGCCAKWEMKSLPSGSAPKGGYSRAQGDKQLYLGLWKDLVWSENRMAPDEDKENSWGKTVSTPVRLRRLLVARRIPAGRHLVCFRFWRKVVFTTPAYLWPLPSMTHLPMSASHCCVRSDSKSSRKDWSGSSSDVISISKYSCNLCLCTTQQTIHPDSRT